MDGFQSWELKAKAPAPRYQQTVKLLDVVFIPSFFTNVVSLKRLIKGGVEWLTKEDKLMLGNQIICLLEEKFGQWVLEYNPTAHQQSEQPSTFVTRSSQARTSKAQPLFGMKG